MYYYRLEDGLLCSPEAQTIGEEITEAEYRECLERYLSSILYDGTEKEPSILDKMGELLEANKPDAEKLGYHLELAYENGGFLWTYVKDEADLPSGSYTNPTPWVSGMAIFAGANDDYISDGWYEYDGLPQRCIKDGCPESFTDTEYWEVI